MKKRLRKKLHLGEYQVLGFQLSAVYPARSDEELDVLTGQLLDFLEEHEMSCSGTVGEVELDLFVVTGTVAVDGEAKRRELQEFVRALPGLEQVETGELIDAFYGPC